MFFARARAFVSAHLIPTLIAAALVVLLVGFAIGSRFGSLSGGVVASPSPSPSPSASAAGSNGQRGLARQLIKLVANQTGVSTAHVRDQLQSGSTLSQVAGSKSQSVQQAELAALKSKLDAKVAAGKLTSAQEQRRLTRLRTQIGQLMGEPGPQVLALIGSSGASTTTT